MNSEETKYLDEKNNKFRKKRKRSTELDKLHSDINNIKNLSDIMSLNKRKCRDQSFLVIDQVFSLLPGDSKSHMLQNIPEEMNRTAMKLLLQFQNQPQNK